MQQALAAAALTVAALTAAPADAREYEIWSCRSPHDLATPAGDSQYGWQGGLYGGGPGGKHVDTDCSDREFGGTVSGAGTQPLGSGLLHRFHAPPDTEIREAEIYIAGTIRTDPASMGEVALWHSGQSDPYYMARWLGHWDGPTFNAPWSGLDPRNRVVANNLTVSHYTVKGQCHGSAPCPAGPEDIARYRIFRSRTVLDDAHAPAVGPLTGSFVADGTLRGVVHLGVSASDRGSGVLRVTIDVDGNQVLSHVFDPSGGKCSYLPSGRTGRQYLHVRPCPLSGSADLAINTRAYGDGHHGFHVRIEDAAGLRTTAYHASKYIDNVPPPQSRTPPSIVGHPRAGGSLVGEHGDWTGDNNLYALQWQRCDQVGGQCRPIAGATGRVYDVRPEDAGSTLRLRVTATNGEGSTERASEATARTVRIDGSLPACADDLDNEDDGATDQADTGCAEPADDSEGTENAACANGVDDDHDGRTDLQDPGCQGRTDPSEHSDGPACSNGFDDDRDGRTDLDDRGCTDPADTTERSDGPACGNGIDDDGDGRTDTDDLGCNGEEDPSEDGPVERQKPQPAPQSASPVEPRPREPGAPAATVPGGPRLTASFVASGKRSLRVGYGVQPVVRGRLVAAPGGAAVPGALIETTHELAAGLGVVPKAAVKTDSEGRFALILPPSLSSRTIWLSYRRAPGDAVPAAEQRLRLAVRAETSFAVLPAVVRNGRRVRFRGRVRGPVPRQGVHIVLQALVGPEWRTFRSTRTDRRGRWVEPYRFRRTYVRTRYAFRARVLGDSAFPFAPGTSFVRRVLVRP